MRVRVTEGTRPVDSRSAFPNTLQAGLRLLGAADVPALYTDSTGCALGVNDAWRAVLGESGAEPWEWLSPFLPDSRTRAQRVLEQATQANGRVEVDVESRTPAGEVLTFTLVGGAHPREPGVDPGVLVIAWDITERRRTEERLAFIAGHDSLTGLPNRRTLLEALERAVSRADRGTPSVFLAIDLDHLKEYNDAMGHLAGDQALVNVALTLRRHVRASDVPARIGGDEFAVIFEGADVDEAAVIAERMRHAVSAGESVPGSRAHGLALSGGLAMIEAGTDARTVLNRADVALYAAKAAGRDRIVIWDRSLSGGEDLERVEAITREAFERDGFFLVYQPIVRLGDRRLAYFESLVRMRSPDGVVYGPDEFLPFVDAAGMMPRLTRWIVSEALARLAAIEGCSISVNLSSADLSDRALLDHIERMLVASDGMGPRLVFEISEGTMLAGLPQARAWMRRLGETGCSFALDDFGSGAGIFALVREPRVGLVKLSRMVVRALADDEGTRAFVIAMRELIESQGKTAVATFLETEQLMGEVADAGFTVGQGYRLSEPRADLARLVDEFGCS